MRHIYAKFCVCNDEVCQRPRRPVLATHWMSLVFPQLRGLGRTGTAQFYGIESAEEALRYWVHPVPEPRLKLYIGWVRAVPQGKSAHDVFGSPDDLKFRSCLTLFQHVVPNELLRVHALARFDGGSADKRTVDLLANEAAGCRGIG